MTRPVFIDATMLLRWKQLAPVGIVRLERLLCGRVYRSAALGTSTFIVWDRGYRPATAAEVTDLDRLLIQGSLASARDSTPLGLASATAAPSRAGRAKSYARGKTNVAISRLPTNLRPLAQQAIISSATLGVESARHVKRAIDRKRLATSKHSTIAAKRKSVPVHRVDFSGGGDLVALGLGWEYLDHEAMYDLKQTHDVRIHMPAFDLIPIEAPQFNAAQRHMVHRYYAEMAHYADTVTCISQATLVAIRAFFDREQLPQPYTSSNALPGMVVQTQDTSKRPLNKRFTDRPFVLSVSTIEIRKNHLLLAKLWSELISEGRDVPDLVIVGRLGWDVTELLRWVENAPELQGKVFLVTDVDDPELLDLYDRCQFTLFPSRTEGWGLPITESLMRGKVCVHSTDLAQTEASQGLMPALHPDDFFAWKSVLLQLLDDPTYRQQLEASIASQYSPRTPDQYCDTFEQLLIARRSMVQQ